MYVHQFDNVYHKSTNIDNQLSKCVISITIYCKRIHLRCMLFLVLSDDPGFRGNKLIQRIEYSSSSVLIIMIILIERLVEVALCKRQHLRSSTDHDTPWLTLIPDDDDDHDDDDDDDDDDGDDDCSSDDDDNKDDLKSSLRLPSPSPNSFLSFCSASDPCTNNILYMIS